MRKIAVMSGDRADYGLLRPVLKLIDGDKSLKLDLLLGHIHFDLHKSHNDATRDGYAYTRAEGSLFGRQTDFLYKYFMETRPDFVLVLGDRESALAAAFAAARSSRPLGHIHGGDKIDSGHIDEPIRHSITRFAHLHFTACASSAGRLLKMGEEPWRVQNVGTPAIDAYIQNSKSAKKTREEILSAYGLSAEVPFILVMQHPTLLEKNEASEQIRVTLEAVKKEAMQALIIYPNGDPGTDDMIKVIEKHRGEKWATIHRSIHHEDFCRIFESAAVVVGNSSAGIIEGSYLGVPMVHVGSRNRGREHGSNVIFCGHDAGEINKAIKRAMTRDFRKKASQTPNIYGYGDSSKKIVKMLKTVKVDDKFMKKVLTY